ncbi:helix-turn-helix domain-containing protein [Bordetella sp. 2513F-2]
MTQDSTTPMTAAAAPADEPASVGSALRALRTARGWSLDEVSSRIKFSPRQIQALEEERWNDLPTGMPLRGLIRNYARLLGADGETIAAAVEAPARAPAATQAAPRRTLGSAVSAGVPVEEDRGGPWGWLLAILAVVAIAVGYAFWQGWLPQEWLAFQWILPASH